MVPISLENRDSRSSRATGVIVQCGGVHLEWMYIFGSYVVDPSFGGLPAKIESKVYRSEETVVQF